MSVLNIIVSHDRAWVAVDTAGTDACTGNALEVSKMVPLVHASLVLAARGATTVMHNLAAWCMSLDRTADFDLLAGFPPGWMDEFHTHLASQVRAQTGREPAAQETEIVIVGWSASQQRMALLAFRRGAGMDSYQVQTPDIYIAPWPGDEAMNRLAEITVPNMAEYMRVVSDEQMAWSKHTNQVGPIGGRLLIAEVTRDAITIRDAGAIG